MAGACDINERFDILIFESAEEYCERKRAELEENKLQCREYMRKIEFAGICEGCKEAKKYLRWVRDNEYYVCYDCFIHDLECEADVRVPMTRVVDMEEYMSRAMWEGLCEEEGEVVSTLSNDDDVTTILIPIEDE